MYRKYKLISVLCITLSCFFSSLVIVLPKNSLALDLPERPQSLHVYAGRDFMAESGLPVTMDADVRIGSLPCRPEVDIQWSVVNGNGSFVSFNDVSTIDAVVTFWKAGTYTLRLFASYKDDSSYDDVSVEVYKVRPAPGPENDTPIVDIGENDKIYVPSYPGKFYFENATVTDDGFPLDPGKVSVLWEVERAPTGATVSFDNRNVANAIATFSDIGLYKLILSAYDGEKRGHDYIEIEVYYIRPPLGPENEAPIVDIGENDTIEISSDPGYYYFINASITDDGFPNPPAMLYIEWSLINSPSGGDIDFVTSPQEVNTEIVFSKKGKYTLQLSAYDSELTSYDTVTVNVVEVRPAPEPGNGSPYVDIGEDKPILISSDPGIYRFVNAWVIDDGNPIPPGELEINWSLIESYNGGEVEFIEGADEINVTAHFSKPDTYILRLTADDGEKSSHDEVTVKVIYVRPTSDSSEVTDKFVDEDNTQEIISKMMNIVRILMSSFF